MAEIIHTTDDTFKADVLDSATPVLVDFWAEWCGPCREMGPILDELAAEYGDKVKVVKMNVDDNQKTPSGFNIMGIPTMIVFQGGEVKAKMVGKKSKKDMVSQLAEWL